ncbi:YetF domain-containing protein [Roseovarius sp. E0-M6]|uniref:YetF domain-containing protein n=1 Tax=Roseovarius sp. E0-M6 TaxID=3127118 RepID=UPI00300FB996
MRFGFVDRILENTPLLVMEGREVLDDNLAKADMTRQDLWAKLREANIFDLDVVRAVIVERSGEVSVLYDDGVQRTMSDEPLSDVRR